MLTILSKIAKTVGSWLAILVVTIALLELVLRAFDQLPVHKNPLSGFQQADSILGWIGKPDYRGRFRSAEFDVLVEHDDLGFRLADYAGSDADGDAESIVFLGDSFTWGWGIESDELFTSQFQRMRGDSAAVTNLGVNAYGTSQELLLFDNYGGRLDPDVVVVMFFSNDLRENSDAKKGRRPWFELDGDNLVPRNQPVQRVSVGPFKRLAQESVAIATLKYTYYLLKGALDSPQETRVEEPEPVVEPESWKLLSALFGQLRDRCGVKAGDCELRVVYIPTREEVLTYGPAGSSAVLANVREICAQSGIPFLDLSTGLYEAMEQQGSLATNGTPVYFPTDGHWDSVGHSAVAKTLFENWETFSAPNRK